MKSLVKAFITALVLGVAANGFAQDIASEQNENVTQNGSAIESTTKEVGAYERKSVAFLNIALTKGNHLNQELTDYFIKTLQNSVRMPRFDYNNIPQSVIDEFKRLPETMSIEERMDKSVVPAILAVVDAEKEMRAMNLLSEQQKNSFITDKAKELGITEAELNAVMNSAYIFAPVYIGHTTSRYEAKEFLTGRIVQMFKVTLTAGGYWWKIDNSGDTPKVKLIGRIERTASGSEEVGISNYQTIAFNKAINSVASDVGVATKALPDFKLTGQILDKNLRNVVISVGKPEGVAVDNKYYVIESSEDVDGNVSEKQRGWVMVTKVGEDAKGLDSMQSQAQIISGIPYIGAKLEEIPVQPIDVSVAFVMVPYKVKIASGTLDMSPFQYGPRLKIGVNTAALGANVSQLWINISGEYLFGSVDNAVIGDDKIIFASSFGGELSIMKKFYARRFAFAPEIGVGFKNYQFEIETYYYGYDQAFAKFVMGGFVNAGLEFALHPQFNLGAFAGFNVYGGLGGKSWRHKINGEKGPAYDLGATLSGVGPAFGFYGTYSIPSGSRKERQNDVVN